MLEDLKIYLGIEDETQDQLLKLIIKTDKANFKIFTNADPEDYESIILRMCVEDYNRIGMEGIASLSFGAGSETALQSYSADLQKMIKGSHKIKIVY